ncbi:GNAT family N-acetyltransferase [Thermaurantiacus tibetensis]|uniref:GNAT family N-acetyltransferase n=1 Tax=Thermaurantiacus tibetensis TaxID=2759035 RepID=UPI00188F011E|nr:GNAT family N-acetyltransferase [Thermaurantiacus tibetensis]
MSSTSSLRPATIADGAACAALYAPHVLRGTGTFEIDPPEAREMAARIAHVLARGWPWLLLEQPDGKLLGYAYVSQFRDRAAYARTGETSIYVAEGETGRGHGRALLEALLPAAAAAGFRTLLAVIGDSGNAASIALHRGLGFRQAGLLEGVGEKFGRRLDVVLMQREL